MQENCMNQQKISNNNAGQVQNLSDTTNECSQSLSKTFKQACAKTIFNTENEIESLEKNQKKYQDSMDKILCWKTRIAHFQLKQEEGTLTDDDKIELNHIINEMSTDFQITGQTIENILSDQPTKSRLVFNQLVHHENRINAELNGVMHKLQHVMNKFHATMTQMTRLTHNISRTHSRVAQAIGR